MRLSFEVKEIDIAEGGTAWNADNYPSVGVYLVQVGDKKEKFLVRTYKDDAGNMQIWSLCNSESDTEKVLEEWREIATTTTDSAKQYREPLAIDSGGLSENFVLELARIITK